MSNPGEQQPITEKDDFSHCLEQCGTTKALKKTAFKCIE